MEQGKSKLLTWVERNSQFINKTNLFRNHENFPSNLIFVIFSATLSMEMKIAEKWIIFHQQKLLIMLCSVPNIKMNFDLFKVIQKGQLVSYQTDKMYINTLGKSSDYSFVALRICHVLLTDFLNFPFVLDNIFHPCSKFTFKTIQRN